MVKRLKAILLLTLMLGSARFAKAETPKGEAHVSNKTNIETQAPQEDSSSENDVVSVDEKTGEEVIIAQSEDEEILELSEEDVIKDLKENYAVIGNLSNDKSAHVLGLLCAYYWINYDILPEDFKSNPMNPKYLPKDVVKILDWYSKKCKHEFEIGELSSYALDFTNSSQMENMESLWINGDIAINPGDICHDAELKLLINALLEKYKMAFIEANEGCLMGEHYHELVDYYKDTTGAMEDSKQKVFFMEVSCPCVADIAITTMFRAENENNEEVMAAVSGDLEEINAAYDSIDELLAVVNSGKVDAR